MATQRYCLSGMLGLLLSLFGGAALADGVGQVVHLNGTLRILARGSEVNAGDTLITQADSYVQLGFTDGSTMTMRPNTRIKIEAYAFNKEQPNADNAFFRLLRGGLRTAVAT
ncbi:MAG: FecR domain-containing protein [Proteobacteria bacterium]|nr:FecR domain-containing protein [Pseudomonadota bacterium]